MSANQFVIIRARERECEANAFGLVCLSARVTQEPMLRLT